MNEYFLHIGLHKTGTKFFQHKVFPNLPKKHFLYNPPKLTQLICDLIKADNADTMLVLDKIKHAKEALQKNKDRTIVISREVMSGDLFSFYKDFEKTSAKLQMAFHDARIICFLRYQLDWIISCYRETVHEHHYQSIEEFLSFKVQENNDFVRNNYKALDLNRIIKLLISDFGQNNVNFFFYEDFKENKQKVVDDISRVIGSSSIQIRKDKDKIPNRGYSAFSIKLSLYRYKIFKFLRLEKFFIHRPIWFFGSKSIPAGFAELSVLPKEIYWHNGFWRDNEEIRSKDYPDLLLWEKIKFELSWRNLIKKRIDKLFYFDWYLLSDYRSEIDEYFKKENRKLRLNHIPKNYI